MATRASIAADLAAARRQADSLDQAASRLSSAAGGNGLEGALNSVSRNWTGNNANNYLSKGQRVQQKMNKSANDLRNAANTIRQVAQNIYNAELRNIEIAEAQERARREAEAAAARARASRK